MVTHALRRSLIVLSGLLVAFGMAACKDDLVVQADPTSTTGASVTAHPSGSVDPTATPGVTADPTATSTSANPSTSRSTSKPPSGTSSAPGGSQPTTPGKPGASNTGVKAGISLTVVNGDKTFSGTGHVVENQDFHGFVRVTGSGWTFRNCVFRGGPTSGNKGLLDTESGQNTVVEDSEFVPSNPSATIDNIWAANTSIYRANIHGGVDGVKILGAGNVLIQDSWIHNMTWFASDPNQGGGETHNDGVQGFDGTTGVTLRHNNIDMSSDSRANAAFQNSTQNAVVDGNWLDGGGCTLNFAPHAIKLVIIAVTNNRFGHHQYFNGCVIKQYQPSVIQTNSGNVWDDTGKAVPGPQ
jgi:hypothetical protein